MRIIKFTGAINLPAVVRVIARCSSRNKVSSIVGVEFIALRKLARNGRSFARQTRAIIYQDLFFFLVPGERLLPRNVHTYGIRATVRSILM